jgi:hypothetical protein
MSTVLGVVHAEVEPLADILPAYPSRDVAEARRRVSLSNGLVRPSTGVRKVSESMAGLEQGWPAL